MLLGVNIEYWSGGSVVPAFTWSDAVSLEYLYRWRLIPLLLLLAGAYGTRTLVVGGYRKRRRDEYRQYEEARTQSLFDARSRLEKARASWQKGDTAKALVALQEILADNPTYGEARELKRLISRGKDAHVAVSVQLKKYPGLSASSVIDAMICCANNVSSREIAKWFPVTK